MCLFARVGKENRAEEQCLINEILQIHATAFNLCINSEGYILDPMKKASDKVQAT